MATIRPLHDRVLVRPHERRTMTDSGLHLSEHYKPEETGTVVAIGVEVTAVKVLDPVIFSWAVGQELWLNDGAERYLMMRERDISAVMESA